MLVVCCACGVLVVVLCVVMRCVVLCCVVCCVAWCVVVCCVVLCLLETITQNGFVKSTSCKSCLEQKGVEEHQG